MSERCEVCERQPVTQRCAGLDVPQLGFCAQHAAEHERGCPDIAAGRAVMLTIDKKEHAMGTKLNPGHFDCYHNAEPDEPMFILLARDAAAPALVEAWADARERAGTTAPEKIAEARACAEAMREWRRSRRP